MNCDHQFQNVNSDDDKSSEWKPYKFVCPFCGHTRTVNRQGEIVIVVKGLESPKP